DPLARSLFDEIARWPIYDPHSHIDALRPAARNLEEILGYHYYTELCHSAGLPANALAAERDPAERTAELVRWLERIDNTVQYSWLVEIARTFHGVERVEPGTLAELEKCARRPETGPEAAAWDRAVWERTNLEAVFLTNEFDDPLEGWDTTRYVPCLR